MISEQELIKKAKDIAGRFDWYEALISGINTFADFPYMDRQMLDKHYYCRERSDSGLTAFTTSGTSTGGKRSIFYTQEELLCNNNQKIELFGNFLGSLDRVAVIVGIGLAASSAKSVFESMGKEVMVIPHDETLDVIYDSFRSFRPQALYSMPSLLQNILCHMPESCFLEVRKTILVGEILSPMLRRSFAESMRVESHDILNTYGCVELGLLAYECVMCGRFHVMPGTYAESIRLDGEIGHMDSLHASGCHYGIMVYTSLWRTSFPGIKYISYDIANDFKVTSCNGKEIPSFKAILGRYGNEFKHGERISIYDIENALLGVLKNAVFDVTVIDNRMKIELLDQGYSASELRKAEQAINRASSEIGIMIENRLLNRIEIVPVDKLRRAGPSFKKKVFRERS